MREPMNIANPSVANQTTFTDLTHKSTTFMWNLLLLGIILRMENTLAAKSDMIRWCRHYYKDEEELKYIDDFEKNYEANKDEAVWWYTEEPFIYRLVNLCLRSQDIDNIYQMRYFIIDLHNQIQKLYTHVNQHEQLFTVYRGQSMSEDELQNLKDHSNGGLISFHQFLSCTRNRNTALVYALNRFAHLSNESVLFEIIIDTNIKTKPFLNIERYSYYKTENEILFTVGTIFEIMSVEQQATSGLWIIKLLLSEKVDKDMEQLTMYFRNEIGKNPTLITLADYLTQMGNYDAAKTYFDILIDTMSSLEHESNDAELYTKAGQLYYLTDDYEKSLKYHLKASSIITVCNLDLALVEKNIGKVYKAIGKYDSALMHYERALDIEQQLLSDNHPDIAETYKNIGEIYNQQGDHAHALGYYERAQQIVLKLLPPNHPGFSTTYNNIDEVYYNRNDDTQVMNYHEKALQIRLSSLPPDHPSIVEDYLYIGKVCYGAKEFDKCLKYYKKSLEIRLMSLSSNHPSTASVYNSIGKVYYEKGNYIESLSNYKQAIKIQSKSLPINHPDLIDTYQNIKKLLRQGVLLSYNYCIEELINILHDIIVTNINIKDQHNILESKYKQIIDIGTKLLNSSSDDQSLLDICKLNGNILQKNKK
ncbi:unnamed protein product [Didymodactylos carnosus]|uniref:ADP ribosyltransferase domain-containing protein n=1 Tax=Didymodactylos carnosus TaxID=1234261 RepID=A0A8S2DTI6_9BILA|nr:unnamed protein product [Didymodactylos carnosus]CAF3748295.1 unnamed protein product [Didymodactylos carnosus]